MNAGVRNGTLSPVSTDSQEWSPITRYTNLAGENPYSPTLPPSTYGGSQYGGSNADGGMLNGMRSQPNGNGNPSPPSSIGRSSDGAGLYAASLAGSDVSTNTNSSFSNTSNTSRSHSTSLTWLFLKNMAP